MSYQTSELGGRLPLVAPETLSPAQRSLYDRIDAVMVPWADRVGFQSKTKDGRFIGPFNPILFSPEVGESFLALQREEEKHTGLSQRLRQIVILSVGSIWQAAYELYAHAAAARAAGLSDDVIDDLAAGRTPAGLPDEERAAQRFTLQLAADRRVDDEVYHAAANLFGEKGVVDMVVLAGCYHTVCSILNAFAVPAPAATGTTASKISHTAKEH